MVGAPGPGLLADPWPGDHRASSPCPRLHRAPPRARSRHRRLSQIGLRNHRFDRRAALCRSQPRIAPGRRAIGAGAPDRSDRPRHRRDRGVANRRGALSPAAYRPAQLTAWIAAWMTDRGAERCGEPPARCENDTVRHQPTNNSTRRFSRVNGSAMCMLLSCYRVVPPPQGETRAEDSSIVNCCLRFGAARRVRQPAAATADGPATRPDGRPGSAAGRAVCGAQPAAAALRPPPQGSPLRASCPPPLRASCPPPRGQSGGCDPGPDGPNGPDGSGPQQPVDHAGTAAERALIIL